MPHNPTRLRIADALPDTIPAPPAYWATSEGAYCVTPEGATATGVVIGIV